MFNKQAAAKTLSGPRTRLRHGVSLVEIMIGLVVSLLVSLAAANTAMMFTAQQRQGMGAGGAAVNVNAVMSSLRDDVAVAGLGFFGDATYLCNKLNFSVNGTMVSNGADFSPLQVTREAGGDRIDVVWATRVESGANVRLRDASAGTSSSLTSYLPTAVNDAVLLAPPAPSNTVPCLVRSVTAVTPSTATAAQVLTFANTGRHNAMAFTTNPGFTDEGRVTQLGAVNWVRYRVRDGNLILERPLDGTSVVIARNVISFRLQYGVAAAGAGSTSLESWVDPSGTFAALTGTNLPRVRALRIGLIVRSPQIEKSDAGGNCSATDTKPALWGATAENLSNADWACWRYRSSTLVVPMRNIVLGLM